MERSLSKKRISHIECHCTMLSWTLPRGIFIDQPFLGDVALNLFSKLSRDKTTQMQISGANNSIKLLYYILMIVTRLYFIQLEYFLQELFERENQS